MVKQVSSSFKEAYYESCQCCNYGRYQFLGLRGPGPFSVHTCSADTYCWPTASLRSHPLRDILLGLTFLWSSTIKFTIYWATIYLIIVSLNCTPWCSKMKIIVYSNLFSCTIFQDNIIINQKLVIRKFGSRFENQNLSSS